jgi:hypothetical protein
MKLASFWRTSLSDSESQRIYFDHFEIHPIKVSFHNLFSLYFEYFPLISILEYYREIVCGLIS